tara:strand:+ start:2159 stop:3220 length:1062 start_codon:yes stop_codon:yes gene_type:complete
MSKVRAEEYTDKSGTGAPNFSRGIVVSVGSSVGIGSTFPDRTLHVAQANSTAYSSTDFDQKYHVLKLQNFTDDKSVGLQFKIGTNGEAAITAQESSNGETQLMFGTRGGGNRAERLRIDSAGRMGLGVTPPTGYGSGRISLDIHSSGATASHLALTNSTTGSDGSTNGFNIVQNGLNTLLLLRESGFMSFSTAGTERVRILSSGGITFNGDTSSANALDDYEENSWTPVFAGATSAGTYTYGSQVGRYTKIGNMVHAHFKLENITTGSAGTGNIEISGLPYVSDLEQVSGNMVLDNFNLPTGTSNLAFKIANDQSKFTIVMTIDNLPDQILEVTDKVDNAADIQGTISYLTDS